MAPSERPKVLETIAARLRKTDEKIVAAYAFGSFLRPEPFRDIDIGILLASTPSDPLQYELETEGVLSRHIRLPVDVRLLNQAPVSFSQAAIRGKVIVDADPDCRSDFENRTLKHYFDFARYRRRYLAEVRNAPV